MFLLIRSGFIFFGFKFSGFKFSRYKFSSILALCLLLVACEPGIKLKPLPKQAVILAFGDSLTYGTGASRNQSYPAQLQQLTNRKVINAGIAGEISTRGLQRLPGLLNTHQPDLVILCHGANDILRKLDLSTAKSNLQKMIHLIQQSGAQVILLAVPEFSLFLSPAPFYNDLANENQIPLLEDIFSKILKNPALKSDQIHPNDAGYRELTLSIIALLEQHGALSQLYY